MEGGPGLRKRQEGLGGGGAKEEGRKGSGAGEGGGVVEEGGRKGSKGGRGLRRNSLLVNAFIELQYSPQIALSMHLHVCCQR